MIIPLEDVGLPFTAAKGFPIDQPAHPRPMPVDRHGIIAAVDHPIYQRFADALRCVPPANRHIEGAVVAVKIGETASHPFEHVKIFRVGKTGLGSAMRGDDVHAAFEG